MDKYTGKFNPDNFKAPCISTYSLEFLKLHQDEYIHSLCLLETEMSLLEKELSNLKLKISSKKEEITIKNQYLLNLNSEVEKKEGWITVQERECPHCGTHMGLTVVPNDYLPGGKYTLEDKSSSLSDNEVKLYNIDPSKIKKVIVIPTVCSGCMGYEL